MLTNPLLACVVLAHADPTQVHRLVGALDPFPVFLHCDVSTAEPVFRAMVDGLPERCTVLPRMSTGWAKWENVAAEVAGYRAALETTDATHVALLTGTDYPLASTTEIADHLGQHLGESIARFQTLPIPAWGRSGGFARLRYRHRAYDKHMLRLPVPRRLPADVVPAGGSQLKVLARHHAQAAVDVVDGRPDLVRFWRSTWVADETFIASVMNSPALVPDWPTAHVDADLWAIMWDGVKRKSPPWLTIRDIDGLAAMRADGGDGRPRLFARKFSTDVDTAVLDAVDSRLRGA